MRSFFYIIYYYLFNKMFNMLQYSTLNFKKDIFSEYLGERILNLLDYSFSIPKSYVYNIFEVTKDYISRPDLISLDAYGDDMFADIICKINGISNPFELNEGMRLILPSPEYILEFAIKPSEKDSDDVWGPNMENKQIKTKKDKRQANEHIVGDSRFRIDKKSKVIIY